MSRAFPAGETSITVLHDIDLTIQAGEFVAIIGASGSGKSTLMNILSCLDPPTAGRYQIAGGPTGSLDPDELAALRRENFGFIFQRIDFCRNCRHRAMSKLRRFIPVCPPMCSLFAPLRCWRVSIARR